MADGISASTCETATDDSGTVVAAWCRYCKNMLVFSASRPATTLPTLRGIEMPSDSSTHLMILPR
jgi:hypothetical protein